MTYKDRLNFWAIIRVQADQDCEVVARYHQRSDAEGHLSFFRQTQASPGIQFKVVFDVPQAG